MAFSPPRSRILCARRNNRRPLSPRRHFAPQNDGVFARLLTPPKSSFFLLGPWGTGKTTWLTQHFPAALSIDLLDETRCQRYVADPGAFEREVRQAPDGARVVVDEIQRLPALLNEIHRQIERRRLKFALAGSSARNCAVPASISSAAGPSTG